MTEQEENALLCNRLLGWRQLDFELFDVDGTINGRRTAPTFLTGDDMLLLLDAMEEKCINVYVEKTHTSSWWCYYGNRSTGERGDTAPSAVRAAALAYVRGLP